MIATAVSLRRRGPLGLLFAAPLLTFSAAMGVAVLAMFYSVLAWEGVPAAPVVVFNRGPRQS